MSFFRICAVVTAALLTACAQQQPLYQWGRYEPQVYEYLKGEPIEAQIAALEEDRQKALASGQKLPPGFEAHLGLLYSRAGQDERFQEALNSEKQRFPESTTYVDSLLSKFRN